MGCGREAYYISSPSLYDIAFYSFMLHSFTSFFSSSSTVYLMMYRYAKKKANAFPGYGLRVPNLDSKLSYLYRRWSRGHMVSTSSHGALFSWRYAFATTHVKPSTANLYTLLLRGKDTTGNLFLTILLPICSAFWLCFYLFEDRLSIVIAL